LRDLIILGGGVHSAEMVEIVERINRSAPTWNLVGCLSPHESRAGDERNGCPILGTAEAISRYPNAAFVPDNEWKLPLPRSDRLVSLIDPSVFLARSARIGPGCVVYPNGFIGFDASLGERVFCLSGAVINHHCGIGDRVVLASCVTLAGHVTVEQDCYLGQSCSVKQYVRIGTGCLVGMGAVVIRDVPAGSTVVGNPGRALQRPPHHRLVDE